MIGSEGYIQGKTLDMEQIERNIQKNIVNFCKMLPGHVEKWRVLLADALKPAKALGNYSEQLRHVEGTITLGKHIRMNRTGLSTIIDRFAVSQGEYIRCLVPEIESILSVYAFYSASITYLENFTKIQETLKHRLYTEIEEELKLLKNIIDQLNQSAQDLKNKLSLLERSTLDLNWESDTELIMGSPIQPPLSHILDQGFKFCLHFSRAVKQMNEQVKAINVRDEECMKTLEESFNIELDEAWMRNFLAIVQYINNECNIT